VRAMERNGEQKKTDLKTWQRHLPLAPPPGDGGGKGAMGWAGDLGKQTRLVRVESAQLA
jgi:hypothetical protein